ncbi:MAG TPA: hypothetical protein VFJ05_07065 [Nitrososphaeraceae archaeon]|nr:hypothetical protein [Nitrososphaeraceae archaeon]
MITENTITDLDNYLEENRRENREQDLANLPKKVKKERYKEGRSKRVLTTAVAAIA